MLEFIHLAQLEEQQQTKVIEKKTTFMKQAGLIHSKIAGRFEIVKKLPKEADSFDAMFEYADTFGKFRLAYIDSAHKISNIPNKTEKVATSVGGEFGFDTAEYNGISLHISTYMSQGIGAINPSKDNLNEDFFDTDSNSFSYIAEASAQYTNNMIQAKVGRLRIETPYANSDDIRMAANTFEGVWANIDYTPEFSTQLIYFNRWAGYGSQDEIAKESQNEFKNLVDDESFGMTGISIKYKYAKNSEVSLWHNYIDKMAKLTYAEVVGIYFIEGDNFHLDYGFQASVIKELNNSNVDGSVLGAMSIIHYNGLFLGASYNKVLVDSDNYITNGFGGGPYYTSLDEASISSISEAAPGENAEAFRIGTGYEFNITNDDTLMLELVYGELYNEKGKIVENDIILSYEIDDKWLFESTYTKYKSSCKNNTFERYLVRADYKF